MAVHSITYGFEGSGISLSKKVSNTVAGVALIDGESVPDSSTDLELTVTLDVSECKSLYIVSDQDVTFEVNNAGSPTPAIALLANKPYVWRTGDYVANLLTVDVTSVFITNASGSAAIIYMIAGYDVTP